MKKVIVIAGTLDSRIIISQLLNISVPVIATVATDYGADVLKEYENIDIKKGKLVLEEMCCLIKRTCANCVVDTSHPYAKDVSINAMGACKKSGIQYVRYERQSSKINYDKIINVDDYKEAAIAANKTHGNILLTTGSNNIEVFTKNILDFKSRLFVRVLPESSVISKCEKLGLLPQNIIAIKGPFSCKMNTEMAKHCNARVVVTKDSGEVGGTLEKIQGAQKLDIPIIMINRPKIEYTNKLSDVYEVVSFVKELYENNEV
ncbi:UNVERIFIED_CONTAM: precorrin-6A/cobalt-precorrin-6A reductase [Acetivibrio alkalicellulosi]